MKTHRRAASSLCIALFCAAACLFLTTAAPGASAETNCSTVCGRFQSQSLPPEDCQPAPICTRGSLTGSLAGPYEFTGSQLVPTGEQSIPSVMFYTGFSTIHTIRGDLYLTDAGALNMQTGSMSALLTVTGGTRLFAKAQGYLFVYGVTDLATGIARGSYKGKICK